MHGHTLFSANLAELPSDALPALGLRFAQKRFPPRLNRSRKRIPLATRDFLAAFDQFVGAFAKFACLLLGKFAAIIGAFGQKFTSIFTRLRRKQNAHKSAYSEPYQ